MSSARGPPAYTSARRSVSIRPGAIELTVIFFGPTSRASVFAQPITPGRTMFELSGVPEPTAREAMRLAAHKLPIKTRFVLREEEA